MSSPVAIKVAAGLKAGIDSSSSLKIQNCPSDFLPSDFRPSDFHGTIARENKKIKMFAINKNFQRSKNFR
jgi:hypothetical protein